MGGTLLDLTRLPPWYRGNGLPGSAVAAGGMVVDDLGDGDAVAHPRVGGAPGGAHGPRAGPGMASSATTGPGARSSPTRMATGSRCCSRTVASTLASTCQ